MRRGTIIKNLWAGYETYFSFQGVANGFAHGYILVNIDGKWNLKKGSFYWRDIRDDREHFPIVGIADVEGTIIRTILGGINPNAE